MANVIVPSKDMLKTKDLYPLNKWHRLNTNHWIWDKGFIDILEKSTGHGKYFVTDKGQKKLWDLITYCDDTASTVMVLYYGYPKHLVTFLKWVWNNVAADDKWKNANGQRDQMDFFPYAMLWNQWCEIMNQPSEANQSNG